MGRTPKRAPGQQDMLASCGEIGPEDGIDPRELARTRMFQSLRGRKANYKALQLCRQVERVLALALHAALPVELSDLSIQSVLPLQDHHGQSRTNLLVVTLQAGATRSPESLRELEYQLQASKGALRTIVAEAINRRKTPDLSFRVVQAV